MSKILLKRNIYGICTLSTLRVSRSVTRLTVHWTFLYWSSSEALEKETATFGEKKNALKFKMFEIHILGDRDFSQLKSYFSKVIIIDVMKNVRRLCFKDALLTGLILMKSCYL